MALDHHHCKYWYAINSMWPQKGHELHLQIHVLEPTNRVEQKRISIRLQKQRSLNDLPASPLIESWGDIYLYIKSQKWSSSLNLTDG